MNQQVDFWLVHGWGFLICIALFPRLTMLIAGTAFKFMSFASPWGILSWVGWVFVPHLVVAILATTYYWNTNPILCVFAWMAALSGTGTEAKAASSRRE